MRLALLGEASLNTLPLIGQARQILAWLALQPQHTATRAKLARELWLDEDESNARRRLTKALYRIKQDFPILEDHLETDNQTIALKNIEVDVLEFEALLKNQNPTDWQTAFDLYQGDLLEGEDAPWLEPWREHLRETCFTGLERALGDAEQKQNISQAILVAQRLVRYNPLSEEAHTRLIRLYANANRREDAILQYATLEKTLLEELSSTPKPELRAYIQTLKHSLEKSEKPHHTLIGRNKELRMLAQQLEAAQAGHGSIIALQGEPGMGKTRLLDELEALGRWHKIPMLRGTAKEQQSNAYAPLEQALQSQPVLLEVATPLMRETLKPLLTEEANATASNSSSSAVGAALERWLGKLERPLLIVLDDLQWAGDLFWALLPVLTRITRQKAVLLVLSYRTYEIQTEPFAIEALNAMRQDNAVLSLEVKALTQDECAALAKAVSKPLDLQELERLYRLSNGNPLVFLEFLGGEDNAERLDSLVQHRLTHLSKQARTALEAASVLGNNFSLEVWTAMLKGDVPLRELLEARFLTQAGENLTFQHDLIRSSIYQSLLEADKQKWHGSAFYALQGTARDVVLVYHANAASEKERVLPFLVRAADTAIRLGSKNEAKKLIQQVLDAIPAESITLNEYQVHTKILRLRMIENHKFSTENLAEIEELEKICIRERYHDLLFLLFSSKLNVYAAMGDKESFFVQSEQMLGYAKSSNSIVNQVVLQYKISHIALNNFYQPDYALPLVKNAVELCELESLRAFPEHQLEAYCALLMTYLRKSMIEEAKPYLDKLKILIQGNPTLELFKFRALFFEHFIATQEHRHEDALRLRNEELEAHRTVGNEFGVNATLQNLISTLTHLGQFQTALIWAEELYDHVRHTKLEMNILATYLARIALLQAKINQFEIAEKTLEPIRDWLKEYGQGVGAMNTWEAIGLIEFQKKQYQRSYEAYSKAIELRANPKLSLKWNILACQSAIFAGLYDQAKQQFSLFSQNSSMKDPETTYQVLYLKYLLEKNPRHLEDARFILLEYATKIANREYRYSVLYGTDVSTTMQTFWQQQDLTTVIAELSRPNGIGTRQVTWTIDSGASDQAYLEQSGKVALRHHRLKRLSLEAAVQDAIPTQEDFAQALGVTLRTIENDLATLRANGMEIRTLGTQRELAKK